MSTDDNLPKDPNGMAELIVEHIQNPTLAFTIENCNIELDGKELIIRGNKDLAEFRNGILDLLKQERNKVLDQLEADVKDTVTIFSETVPADPEWLPLSLLLKAIKKLRVDRTTDV